MNKLRLWSRFSEYDNTVDDDTLRQWAEENFVSHSVQAPCTHLDVVREIAQHAHVPIPIESIAESLVETKFIRGRTVFESLGDALDNIAQNYPGMQWWLTQNGINLAINEPLHIRLGRLLEEEVGALPPQQRGYAFERFLNLLFSLSKLSPRKSFRLIGEQIDGSFQLDHTTYLVEAKWQEELIGNHELRAFAGIVESKAAWTRGLFISYTGFSKDGLHAFGHGTKPIICLNGHELRYILAHGLSLASALHLKGRRAAETGEVFVPIDEIAGRK